MTYIYSRVKYPCGFEVETETKTDFFDFGTIKLTDDTKTICPMHGDKCSKNLK